MRQIGLIRAMIMTKRADTMTGQQREALQQKRLRKLIRHVKANSPYFAEAYTDVDENTPLSQLPPTSKQVMMENFDRWMTDPSITREKVDAFMSDLRNVGRKLEGKYLVYTTSGSTGDPCIVLYDDTANNVSAAIGAARSFADPEDMKRFMKAGGKTMALFADGGFYLASGSVHYNLRRMPWKKKQLRTFEVRRPVAEIVQALNDFQPSMLGCYPTALRLIAAEQEKGNLHIHPVVIMTGGENLTDDVRAYLERVFGCTVQTNYSCTEGGTVACECREHHFHINDDWVILEPVDKDNRPVAPGVRSDKVLLTNLANFSFPIIRFEITDRIVLHNEPCSCGCGRPWVTLEGRTDDILTFSGNIRVAPMNLYAVMKGIHGIRRFQLVQQERDVLALRLSADDREREFALAKEAVDAYLAQCGASVQVVFSEEEPRCHPVSGKFKHVIAMK